MKKIIFCALLCIFSLSAYAQITVAHAWIRATVPAQKATGVFMQLSSKTDARLVDASSPGIRTEIHEMALQDNVMRMRQISGIDLPAGKTIELKPGSYHLMLFDLPQQIKEGDVLPLTLVFENKNKTRVTIKLQVPARALSSAATAHSANN